MTNDLRSPVQILGMAAWTAKGSEKMIFSGSQRSKTKLYDACTLFFSNLFFALSFSSDQCTSVLISFGCWKPPTLAILWDRLFAETPVSKSPLYESPRRKFHPLQWWWEERNIPTCGLAYETNLLTPWLMAN